VFEEKILAKATALGSYKLLSDATSLRKRPMTASNVRGKSSLGLISANT